MDVFVTALYLQKILVVATSSFGRYYNLISPLFHFFTFFYLAGSILKKQIDLKIILASSLTCVLIVSTWIVRNFVVLETNQIIITTSSGAVLAKGWNRDVVRLHTNTKGDLANEGLVTHNYPKSQEYGNTEVEKMRLYKNATLHFIKTNPEKIFPIIITKLKSAFNPFPETPKPGKPGVFALVLSIVVPIIHHLSSDFLQKSPYKINDYRIDPVYPIYHDCHLFRIPLQNATGRN